MLAYFYYVCLQHAYVRTVKQMARKSCDVYQPIASLHFLVTKPEFSDGPVNSVQRKTI